MNTKKNYYLFVPADNIYNKTVDEVIDKIANRTFERNHIPPKYRHLILKVPYNGMSEPHFAFELITKKSFALKTSFLKAMANPLANPVIELFNGDVGIITENQIYSAYIIKSFYQEIIDNGLAGNYDNAVREILNMEKVETKKGLFTKIKKKKY